ncbi:MAG: PD40 domain-containing protein [Bacteroidales bacterium]|nr:PD40 domain-containing protein [Candidatus Cacconaster merdequi]
MRKISLLFPLIALLCSCSPDCEQKDCIPPICPDYSYVTVPRNIAPLDFKVEGASRVKVSINGEVCAKGPFAAVRLARWKKYTSKSDTLKVAVSAKIDGKWFRYLPFDIYVSRDSIDATLLYRRVDPGYELYSRMGIYQRELGSFKERPLLENKKSSPGCMNCHSVSQCAPENFQLHLRGKNGGTYIVSGRKDATVFNMSNPQTLGTVYPYWHPDGRYIAYSLNDIRQSFHNIPSKVLEVYDLASDIAVFDTESGSLILNDVLMDSTKFETFPAFSPDGRRLWFTRSEASKDFLNIRYSLCYVDFDPETGVMGNDIVCAWKDSTRSVSFPRPSYDGKHLLFTVSDYGNFSIWHKEADLYMLDIESGEVREAAPLNSPDTESYHSWSSNSRWVAFSSRREDGRYTRIYIAHCDENGNFSKPFRMPQCTPEDDVMMLQSYNIPEFCKGEVTIDESKVKSTQRAAIKVSEPVLK